jgi:LPXTG-motif cell wall-anchored protein
VSNTAPNAVITGSLKATVGQPFTVKVGADDPSSADMAAQFSYTIDWGDGSPVETVLGPADPLVTHTYTGQGNFDAAFTATDKDGGQGDRTAVVVLAEPATTPTPTPSSSSSSPTSSPTGSTTATTGPTSTSTSSGGSGNLANTGASIGPGPIVAGAALLIGGTALLVLARRRTVNGSHE